LQELFIFCFSYDKLITWLEIDKRGYFQEKETDLSWKHES